MKGSKAGFFLGVGEQNIPVNKVLSLSFFFLLIVVNTFMVFTILNGACVHEQSSTIIQRLWRMDFSIGFDYLTVLSDSLM